MDEIKAVQVNIWGQFVGAVAPLKNKPGFYEFSYSPEFEKGRLELSPILMKLRSKRRFSFPALPQETFYGLPGLLADALPDKFGNALIDEYLSRRGQRR
jgi:serine/threonine-protein kinase HipA